MSKQASGEKGRTVLDPTGQKAAFWQAPVKIVP